MSHGGRPDNVANVAHAQKLSHDGRPHNVADGRLQRYDDDRHGITFGTCMRNLCVYLVTLGATLIWRTIEQLSQGDKIRKKG